MWPNLPASVGEHEAMHPPAPRAIELHDLEPMAREGLVIDVEARLEAAFVRWAEEIQRAHAIPRRQKPAMMRAHFICDSASTKIIDEHG